MPELPEVETVVRDLMAHGIENAFIQKYPLSPKPSRRNVEATPPLLNHYQGNPDHDSGFLPIAVSREFQKWTVVASKSGISV